MKLIVEEEKMQLGELIKQIEDSTKGLDPLSTLMNFQDPMRFWKRGWKYSAKPQIYQTIKIEEI